MRTIFNYEEKVYMKAFFEEFKKFISRGNVMDMAVGIIIGGAFTAIVTSLVDDIIMPVISLITGGMDFSSFAITLGSGDNAAAIRYGAFIQAIISFLLVAFALFLIIKALNKLKKEEPKPEPTEKECPYCKSKISIKAVKCPCCTSDLNE